MSAEADVKALIEADTGVMAALTGGVYTKQEVGKNGITRQTAPNAYAADGFLKPCALIKGRAQMGNWGGLMGSDSQLTGTQQVIEIWLYDRSTWDTLEPVKDALQVLLQRAYVGTRGRLHYLQTLDERDPALSDAAFFRLDFALIGAFGGTGS